jgi:hypothetical protein
MNFKGSEIANLAGGLVCEHVGVVPINKITGRKQETVVCVVS